MNLDLDTKSLYYFCDFIDIDFRTELIKFECYQCGVSNIFKYISHYYGENEKDVFNINIICNICSDRYQLRYINKNRNKTQYMYKKTAIIRL